MKEVKMAQLYYRPFAQRNKLPDVPAVYVIVAVDGTALYVGATRSVVNRFKGHHREPMLRDVPFEVGIIWAQCAYSDVLMLEGQLIKALNPMLNERGRKGPNAHNDVQSNFYNWLESHKTKGHTNGQSK
jgi:excinuclease UvrABC nuclease subunit